MTANWDRARAVADAVLYEGYLLYPYRATSCRNQSRWQWGVVSPTGAAATGIGEDETIATQFLVHRAQAITLTVRFLQLQRRRAERDTGTGQFAPLDQLVTPTGSWLTWDEAVEVEESFGPFAFDDASEAWTLSLTAPPATAIEPVEGGRLVRHRQEVSATVAVAMERDAGFNRVSVRITNTGAPAVDKDDAISRSLIGTHVIAESVGGGFVSLLEPPPAAADAVSRCSQHRCFPVLAGAPGATDLLLVSPIILYDYPEVAEQSETALYDCTEIDELLTLRVLTMTDDEKAAARATDPLAAHIIDRCESMSPEAMARLHGALRDPHRPKGLIPEVPDGIDWWDPLADNAVRPGNDAVLVNGVRVARGSRVRLRPARRADAHDLFYADKTARVASVHEDVDGNKHVGVVVEDDPAADLHESYGRYLYFSPDELEPLDNIATVRSSTWKS